MRYDLKAAEVIRDAFNVQAINADTTTNGEIIDTSEFNSLVFNIHGGVWAAGDATPKIEDGEDASLSDAAEVSDTFLSGTEADAKVDGANQVKHIGYVGKKRYVRLSQVTDNSADLTIGAIAVLSKGNVPAE